MKLIKCYIENFGKLHQQEFTFENGYNQIVEDNGFGKTTLATFIKAMFYGLPATRKTDLNENERKKYAPWQSDVFGGYIEVEIEDNQYKIERFFGKKEAEDTFKITDLKTGKPSTKYNENIGLQLFDLDAEAYERSSFIPQKEIANGINDKISTKLINMIQGTDCPDSFENAIELIKARSSEIKKQRGSSGLLGDVDAEIEIVSDKIDALKNSASAVDALQKQVLDEDLQIEQLSKEKRVLSSQITAYSNNQKLLANKKYITENKLAKEKLETNIKVNEKVLNGQNLTDEQLDSMADEVKNLSELNVKIETLQDVRNVEKREKEILSNFGNEVPKAEEITKNVKKLEEIQSLKAEIANLKSNNVPNQQSQNVAKKSKIIILPIIICILGIIAGSIIIGFNLWAGIGGLIIAIIALLAIGVMAFKNYIDVKTSGLNTSQKPIDLQLLAVKEQKVKEIEEELSAFCEKYGLKFEKLSMAYLYEMLSKVNELGQIEKDKAEKQEELTLLKKQLQDKKNNVDNFLSYFVFENSKGDYQTKLDVLKSAITSLVKDKKELGEITEKLNQFNEKELKTLDNINIEDVNITELQAKDKQTQNEIDNHREERAKLIQKINAIKNELAELDELENQLEQLKEKKLTLKEEHKILGLTKDYLTLANDNLSSKYLKPMKDGLNKYLSLVLDKNYQQLNLDTNLNVSFESYGQSRELEYLSKGYQGVVDLCIRFALIDVLFEKEKPFIILDDPFVNMDEDKISNALKLLKEFSKDYQLIYFVCHKSRGV